MKRDFDVAVVGAGIVGLAHALAAARRGKRVVVIDRDHAANGASIRNFGFVTVTGQEAGDFWRRARRARDVWAEVAGPAGIAVLHRGLTLTYRRPEAADLIDAFLATPMGVGCERIDRAALERLHPRLTGPETLGALVSPHELRVESRTALPLLAAWLEQAWGVTFLWGRAASAVATGRVETPEGAIEAGAVVVCPGDDLVSLFPRRFAGKGITRCRLSMLRLADPGFHLGTAVMSDLGLGRYLGYAALPQAAPLLARLRAEQPAFLEAGVHLIAVQSADGTLVVGDSHHYGDTPDPFAPAEAEALILAEFTAATGLAPPPVIERWTGTYASGPETLFVDTPAPGVRLVVVTCGAGASTAFAIGEEVIASLSGAQTEIPA